MGDMWIIETDVLVVGDGGAGARAAIAAAEEGASVVIITKSAFGRGGASALGGRITAVGAYNCADGSVAKDDTPDEHYSDILNAAKGTCNPKLARILVDHAGESMTRLQRIGVPFIQDDNGFAAVTGCFSSKPRSHMIPGHGTRIVAAQNRELVSHPHVTRLEKCRIVELLVDNGIQVGALVFAEGRGFGIVCCSATVMATGGAGTLFPVTFSPPDITGDGYGVGFRAGAVLANMEFVQFGFSTLHPVKNELEAWVWQLQPKITNGEHREFLPPTIGGAALSEVLMERSRHYPFTSSNMLSRFFDVLVHSEITEGCPSPHGGVWLDFTSTAKSPQNAEAAKLLEITLEWFRKRHIDLKQQLVEVGLVAHAFNGGLVIDEHAQTTIHGLYAAGEVATGPHGADRLGGNMLLASQVFGQLAGQHAVASITSRRRKVAEQLAQIHTAKFEKQSKVSLNMDKILQDLQNCMGGAAGVGRDAQTLEGAIRWLENVRSEFSSAAWNQEMATKWFDLRNLLDTAGLVLHGAILRTESRGTHFRKDFPMQDDNEFARPIFLQSHHGNIERVRQDWPTSYM